MNTTANQRRRRWALIVTAALLLASCNAGVTCQGCAPTSYAYPSQVGQGGPTSATRPWGGSAFGGWSLDAAP